MKSRHAAVVARICLSILSIRLRSRNLGTWNHGIKSQDLILGGPRDWTSWTYSKATYIEIGDAVWEWASIAFFQNQISGNIFPPFSTKGPLLVRLWEILIGQASHIELDQLAGLELGIEGLDGLLQTLHRPQQGGRTELVGPRAHNIFFRHGKIRMGLCHTLPFRTLRVLVPKCGLQLANQFR